MSAPTVLVGRKPVSSYVLACLHDLQQNSSVEVRARGRAIPKAIGAVQVLREGLLKGLEVESVDIGTERLQGKDGREIRVSSISIRLSLPGKEEASCLNLYMGNINPLFREDRPLEHYPRQLYTFHRGN
jgi:DNA-binding protein